MMPMEIDWKVVTEAGESGGYVRLDTDEDAKKLWSALPPDLRLALAKTAPRVLGPRVTQKCKATGARIEDTCGREIRAHYEDDTALRAQGYVLDGETP